MFSYGHHDMGTIGGRKKRRIGSLCDLQPNFRNIQRDDVPPTQNCYLLGSLARSDPQQVWRIFTRKPLKQS